MPTIDISMSRPVTPSDLSRQTSLANLPAEVLEQVYFALDLADRLAFSGVCTALHHVYMSSPPLQYAYSLRTSAYLDVVNEPPAIEASDSRTETTDSCESNSSVNIATITDRTERITRSSGLRSPHTGKVRPTIPSVALAPWPRVPPPKRKTAHLSTAEKYELLSERERRWDKLDAAQVRTFRIAGRAGVYELQEGIFLMCDNYTDADEEKPFSIRLIPLPSSTDPDLDSPIVPTSIHKLSFPISDLTMDPTQDLIVVSEFRPAPVDDHHQAPTHRFHLLTLSDFKPHPLATLPTLDFPPFTSVITQTRQLLQVMGDTLLVLVSRYAAHWVLAGLGVPVAGFGGVGNEEELVAWNWQTGRVLARLGLPENGWFSSFALLTPTTFMVTTTSSISPVLPVEPSSVASIFPPVIQIYSFCPDPRNRIIPVQPLIADPFDDTTFRPVLVAQLNLPTIVPGQVVGSFDIRPDPAFPPLPRGALHTLGERKPFTQDPSKGVVVFELAVGDPPGLALDMGSGLDGQTFEMFVLRETFVDMANEGEERLRRSRLPEGDADRLEVWDVTRTLRWDEWGVEHSRLMETSMPRRHWVCSCSGYRFASLVPKNRRHTTRIDQLEALHGHPPPSRLHDLQIYDFSPYAVRRARSRPTPEADEGVSIEVMEGSHTLKSNSVFKDEVETHLPFVKITRELGMKSNGVMVDDQRVIVVDTEGRRNGEWGDLFQEMTVLCM